MLYEISQLITVLQIYRDTSFHKFLKKGHSALLPENCILEKFELVFLGHYLLNFQIHLKFELSKTKNALRRL